MCVERSVNCSRVVCYVASLSDQSVVVSQGLRKLDKVQSVEDNHSKMSAAAATAMATAS